MEAVPVSSIAEAVGTPFYLYSSARLAAGTTVCRGVRAARPLICYAVKANSNLAVLRIRPAGAGADVVSEGELRRALAAGIPPQRIVFSGVGKTRGELEAALAAGIHQINVEFDPGAAIGSARLRRLAAGPRAVAIRVNPDVDAQTHAKIATGKKENKFGIDIDDARRRLAPGRRTSRHQAGRRGRPYRLAAHRAGAVSRAPSSGWQNWRSNARRRAAVSRASISAAASASATGTRRRRALTAMPRWSREIFGSWAAAMALEPGRALSAPPALLVIRRSYTQGRGRHGSSWCSTPR